MTGRLHPVFTPEKRALFLEALLDYPNVTEACKAIDVNRRTVYLERDANPEFAEAWDRAIKIGISALEDEAHRRAFKGVTKITKQGVYLEYSDTLAIFLLKAHCPEKYMDKVRSELTGAGGTPLNMADDQIAAKLDAIARAAAIRAQSAMQATIPKAADDDDYSDLV